jgi:hypothetical protein
VQDDGLAAGEFFDKGEQGINSGHRQEKL